MKVLRVFFVGLLYGWLMKWVVDKIFLEDNLRILREENAILRQHIISLEGTSVQPNRPASPPMEGVAGGGSLPSHRDDLKMIKGIGPKMEKKLNDAGVYTFGQFARLASGELQTIIGTSQNSDDMLNQAKKFARQGPKG